MMKRILTFTCLLAAAWAGRGQSYEMAFAIDRMQQPMLYVAQHYRDQFIVLDSTRPEKDGRYVFKGRRQWERGIYTLLDSSRKKALTDFTIDGSQKFTIAGDSTLSAGSIKVKGSEANSRMFEYIARNNEARVRARQMEKDKKSSDAAVREQAQADLDALSKEMVAYEASMIERYGKYRFFELQRMFSGPAVPDDERNKAVYYRTHYWDGIDLSDHSLMYTPDLFNKMNYYFFGVLYHADADTICRYADSVLQRVEGDTAMMRYFMDFIMPRYYRSTKNIGWDQVWCYLVRHYYMAGKCGFASKGELSNKRQTCEFLEKSLIGAPGIELLMADTNQSENSADWISSHRFPQKYVILWFWDPDCHHCKEQTATLITLYDSLSAAGNRPFEVYAVGYESDVAKWKKYVKDHRLPFVNVGGPNVNVDYQEAYNVHGAPTMIILNADRQIIMNKTLPTASILPFLEQYEKRHPEQADRPPSRWQQLPNARYR
ncbi:MAG: alkyl hydroperoxide reductase/Thiol specific antioxidant/Mal allergen [bacterium P3]|nr:MAG: alkyl hydroperoxide reductase/Thiol specific antioxidant/Mal allergen [bacterium P3]KWW41831.1 MAG: alkyl hydroperoxide reductase/Thiol specific antioxidant/Mal allergen [bacterium F083]